MTERELTDIELALVGVTPGPWVVMAGSPREVHRGAGQGRVLLCSDKEPSRAQDKQDALFVAYARQDVPALCKALREAWDWCARLSQDRAGETGLLEQGRALERETIRDWLHRQAKKCRGKEKVTVEALAWAMTKQEAPLPPWDQMRERYSNFEGALVDILDVLRLNPRMQKGELVELVRSLAETALDWGTTD